MLRSFLRVAAVAGVALASSGCFIFPKDDPSPPMAEPIEVQGSPEAAWQVAIGTGDPEFAPLEDGAHVAAQHGPQGGSHVWTSLELSGISVDVVQVEIEVHDGNDALVSRAVSGLGTKANEDGVTVIPWLQAYITNDFHGPALIHVRVASPDGSKWATAERSVVVD